MEIIGFKKVKIASLARNKHHSINSTKSKR